MSRYNSLADFTEIQAAFVALVDERARKLGLRKIGFACKVWPELSRHSANSRWSAIRHKATNTGKPQGLLLVDAYRMAEVLGESLAYLIGKAEADATMMRKKKETP